MRGEPLVLADAVSNQIVGMFFGGLGCGHLIGITSVWTFGPAPVPPELFAYSLIMITMGCLWFDLARANLERKT